MLNQKQTALVNLKVDRAREHIRELHSEIRRFHSRDPYSIVENLDPETGESVKTLRIRRRMPPRLAVIVGDVVHNLRSSLDHLAWQLVLANHEVPTRRTAFPISDTVAEFESRGLRKIQGVGHEAACLIKGLKPFKGGNDALWSLHQLNIIDKHRLLVTIDLVRQGMRMGGVELVFQPFVRLPLKSGAELARGPEIRVIDDGVEMKPEFVLDIAFGEPEIVKGNSLVPTLEKLADSVQAVIKKFRS
jgi:hypothetical protein